AGNNVGVAACFANSPGHFLAGLSLAAGDHHLGAELCQQLRRGTADAAAGAGDNSYFACEIERGGFHGGLSLVVIPGRACSREDALRAFSPVMRTFVSPVIARSRATKQSIARLRRYGLLRFARNDGSP